MSLAKHLATHLQQMYVAERDYQMYLCDWSGKIRDQQLKTAFSQQVQGIGTELTNLKHCLDTLGEPLRDDFTSPLVAALREEDQETMQLMPNASPLDMDVHAAMTDVTFGNTEIGMYQGMLTMARVLKQKEIVHLLEDTLQHEENDMQQVTGILNQLIDISQQQQAA